SSPSPPLVAGRTDDPHHLGAPLADIGDAVWRRAAVVDAVAGLELVHVAAELQVDGSGDHDEQLFRIAVGVRLFAGRTAGVELALEDLEVLQRPRCEQQLAAEDPERERRAFVSTENAGPWRAARLEEIGDADAERVRNPTQRRDAGARTPALDLAEEALADAGAV